jgi:hypothetical protein
MLANDVQELCMEEQCIRDLPGVCVLSIYNQTAKVHGEGVPAAPSARETVQCGVYGCECAAPCGPLLVSSAGDAG